MIRRAGAADWESLRGLRLRALHEDPGAFAETYDQALARPPEGWQEWAGDESRAIYAAIDDGRWVGMVAGRPRDDSIWLTALWVDPAARGQGLALRLIEAVADWAREQGAAAVALSVTTNNAGAEAVYARAGFAATGRRRPLPADPSRTEVFLRRPVSPARPRGR
jgi:GNAT superfamily N-acetyltransferase